MADNSERTHARKRFNIVLGIARRRVEVNGSLIGLTRTVMRAYRDVNGIRDVWSHSKSEKEIRKDKERFAKKYGFYPKD